MRKSYKFRLYPTKEQEIVLVQTLDVCRYIYNEFLADRRNAYDRCNQGLTTFDQITQVKYLEFNTEVFSQIKQDVLRRLGKSFDAFFRRCKTGETPGYPRFKGKDRYNSFTYHQSGFKIEGTKLKLSKIGNIKIKQHREVEGKIKTCSIKREVDQWYAVFSVDMGASPEKIDPATSMGIDVGLNSCVTLSNGEQYDSPAYYRKSERSLAVQQKRLSKKKNGSVNRLKQKTKVVKVHRKIRNQRLDFNHKLSRILVNRFDRIVFEDLSIKDMVKNHHLAKSIHDVAWGQLIQMAKSKVEEAGKYVELVNPYNTSQKCSSCGNIVKKGLSVRVHKCPECGLELDRDINAAINILNLSTVGTMGRACGVTDVGLGYEAGSHLF
ncbi:RNA-guided endonuclease InsQ/TnpB family protein [Methanococcoides alaskense]|uniref:Transposase n=1 Tax=Methanococcoides alaskense TaxID=325778 RepID=A0AA90U025_9EURY|nr:transposase [Methanococcoides alaskense]MDA0524395.1 transposase [Methanococcoides alaskense]MDR6223212.1 putative transposase [Methanococcoides alaskense]